MVLRLVLVICVAFCVASNGVLGGVLLVDVPHKRITRDIEDATLEKKGRPEMTSLRVESDILYRYAKTSVASRLANRAEVAQEISFGVVLPQSAFISAFHIELDGKVYDAYVKEKEEARKEYSQAVSQGRTAAKVDLSARDSNRFTVSVNVEAAAKVVFNLTYEELLTRRLGVYRHVINLDPGQVVPELSVIVRIDESNTLSTVRVPTLRVTNEISSFDDGPNDPLVSIERPEPNKATIRWNPSVDEQRELRGEGIKGQLEVEYDVERTANPSQILVSDGYFVHFYSPAELAPLKKHVVFVLDISGSMWNTKLNQLKEAMGVILSDLQTGDFFSIILFSSDVEVWVPSTNGVQEINLRSEEEPNPEVIVPVTPENIKLAQIFVANLETAGATNINDALIASLEIIRLGRKVLKPSIDESDVTSSSKSSPEPMIIFLTDGQANVGQSDPSAIVRGVTQKNKRKTPIFSLAFGFDADKSFLKKLSLKNAAFSRLIYEASDAALQLRDFYRQVASPLLANVTFNYEPTQVVNGSLTNLQFNTLFQGAELVVAGKLEPDTENLRGILLAKSSTGKSRYGFPSAIEVTLPEPVNKTAPSFMEKLWAYLNIQQLLDKQEQEDGVNGTSNYKALQLALKYSFVTPLTSLVVVKPNETSRVDAEDVDKASTDIGGSVGLQRMMPMSTGQMRSYPQSAVFGPPGNAGAMAVGLSGPRGHSGYGGFYSKAASVPYNTPVQQHSYLGPLPPLQLPPIAVNMQTSGGQINFDDLEADHDESIDETVTDTVPRTTTLSPVVRAMALNNLHWSAESNNGTHILIPTNGSVAAYEIGVNEPDFDNESCNINATTTHQGHCRHLPYCIMPEILNDFDTYVTSFFCQIGSFAGVCCPDNVIRATNVNLHSIGG